jgi:hypothetical protein
MPSRATDSEAEERGRVAERVMSASSGMVGACATLIGLVKLVEPGRGLTHVDEYAGVTAVAFVVSALLAYLALRPRRRPGVQKRLETAADVVFLTAMVALAGIGLLFAYDLI